MVAGSELQALGRTHCDELISPVEGTPDVGGSCEAGRMLDASRTADLPVALYKWERVHLGPEQVVSRKRERVPVLRKVVQGKV